MHDKAFWQIVVLCKAHLVKLFRFALSWHLKYLNDIDIITWMRLCMSVLCVSLNLIHKDNSWFGSTKSAQIWWAWKNLYPERLHVNVNKLLKTNKSTIETKRAKLPWNTPLSEFQGAWVHNGAAYTENTGDPKSEKKPVNNQNRMSYRICNWYLQMNTYLILYCIKLLKGLVFWISEY